MIVHYVPYRTGQPLAAALFRAPNPAVVKALLHAHGRIPTPDVRLPLLPATPEQLRFARTAEAALPPGRARDAGADRDRTEESGADLARSPGVGAVLGAGLAGGGPGRLVT